MTTGQRIAAKRKELSLSQEALGEQLGVSRQSIYKWESDSSLPEIDKLVAMSRLFSVPVGWLLGVEEAEKPGAEPEVLTEGQQKMVEEILSRYQQEQPKPPKTGLGKWSQRLLFGLCGIMLACLFGINEKVDQIDSQYNNLAGSIRDVSYSVDNQISSITDRVEEVLKAQNSLTADYGADFVSADVSSNTAFFQVQALPKVYTQGLEVAFVADWGTESQEFPASQDQNHRFSAEITCPLTDGITLSAAFTTGGVRQTQLLDSFSGLLRSSYPEVDVQDFALLWGLERGENGLFHIKMDSVSVRILGDTKIGDAQIQEIQLGLFRNRKLVTWLEPADDPAPDSERYLFYLSDTDFDAQEGDKLSFAALCTDQYGRQWMEMGIPEYKIINDAPEFVGGDYSGLERYDPENWSF